MENYHLVEDATMPAGDVMAGPFHADSLDDCVRLCERHNAVLRGSYGQDGAVGTEYSWQHCNGFVFDRLQRRCSLKNKAMGNIYSQGTTLGRGAVARYVSGYKLDSMVNEINTVYPNALSGMQFQEASPAWSEDASTWLVNGNHCSGNQASDCLWSYCPTAEARQAGVASLKPVGFDVRPGAIVSPRNTTTGPFSRTDNSSDAVVVETFPVRNMQECADRAANRAPFMVSPSGGSVGAYGGVNAWTFFPKYTQSTVAGAAIRPGPARNQPGQCALVNVREPYYQTLTPTENGAISGFATNSLANTIQRFLFGEK